jgi:polyhydroxybutyrate depolymerase
MRRLSLSRRAKPLAPLRLALIALSMVVVLASCGGSSAVNQPALVTAHPAAETTPRAPTPTAIATATPTATISDGSAPGGPRPAPIIYRPPNLTRSKAVPLVIALHASGGTPALFEAKTGWDSVAAAHGFVVAYLGSAAPAWKDPSNVTYISSMIDQIKASQNIDPRRVYVTGFSAGAYISYSVGCRLSNQVAAIAPVSDGMVSQSCHLARPVSELTIIGTNDLIPLQGVVLRSGTTFPAATAVAQRWRGLDNCSGQSPNTSRVGPVTQQTWGSCADGSAVGLYVIQGGIHTYPGAAGTPAGPDAQYNATNAIWAFFAAHASGSLTRPSASLSSVRVLGSGSQRAVRATLALAEAVSVHGTITAGRRTIAGGNFQLGRSGAASLALRVGSAASGSYTLRLKIRDSYGRAGTITRTIQLP